jgi:cyclase
MGELLRAGADKISVNSSAVRDPTLLTEGAARFGSQCVVGSVDAARKGGSWEAYIHGGRTPTGLDAVDWAREMVRQGAGEVLLTSMDQDGVRTGYDLELTRLVAEGVTAPVIASGGAGTPDHIRDAFQVGRASAALLAGILHDGLTTVGDIKAALRREGVEIR